MCVLSGMVVVDNLIQFNPVTFSNYISPPACFDCSPKFSCETQIDPKLCFPWAGTGDNNRQFPNWGKIKQPKFTNFLNVSWMPELHRHHLNLR